MLSPQRRHHVEDSNPGTLAPESGILFREASLIMLSFHFIVDEEAYTCLSIVGLRVVQQVASLENGGTFLFF